MIPDNRQSRFMIGVILIVIAGIMAYAILSQPKVYVEEPKNTQATQSAGTTIDINVSSCFPVDLNDATVDELLAIDGIGEKRAVAIVEYRTRIGGYSSVEQIKQINGISDDLYNQISQYLTV